LKISSCVIRLIFDLSKLAIFLFFNSIVHYKNLYSERKDAKAQSREEKIFMFLIFAFLKRIYNAECQLYMKKIYLIEKKLCGFALK
jgi:hypothetical protein